ncbi:MAG: Uma2 family endonuclease [Chloroflexi bacterium]|nr:Uma2 family endonuclease [Chloroflexota bacterium]MCC6892958.1 Uma2 family endonuclease [Anaerolineae bacterium]
MVDQFKLRMTAAEYLQMPESNQRTELLDGVFSRYGEDEMSPAPVNDHQRLVRRSSRVLEDLIPNGEVFTAPSDVHFDELNVVQPDIFWVAEDSQCVEVDGKYWCGAPDLIIEVLSPGTEFKDRGKKFRLYQKYGVHEYWLISRSESFIEVYTWQEGIFVQQGVYSIGDTFNSPALGGKSVDVNLIFPP